MKKYLCMICVYALILVLTVLPAGAEVEPDVKIIPELREEVQAQILVYNIEILYDMGEINKEKGFSFTVSDNAVISDTSVLAISEGKADKDGKVKFNVTLKAPLIDTDTTPYKIYFNLKNPDIFVDSVTCKSIESLESYQKKIDDITSGTGNLEDKIEMYKEELNLDLKYYNKLTDKTKIFEYLNENKNNINLLNINEYFDQASLFAYLYKGDISSVYDMLYYYNDYLHLENIPYQNMMKTYDSADAELKKAIAGKMQTSYIDDIETVKTKLLENIILVSVEVLSKTDLDKVFSDNQDYIFLSGYGNLTTTVKNQVLTDIKIKKVFENVNSIINFYNEKTAGLNGPILPSPPQTQVGGGSVAVGKNEEDASEDLKINCPFYDISGHWAETSIINLYELGIVNGKTVNTFEPDSAITREEFVKLIVSAFNFEKSSISLSFTDVSDDMWYSNYIKTAVTNGLVKGINETTFGVGVNIKREDIAVITTRLDKVNSLNNENEKYFNDENDISDYAFSSVKKLSALGVINGTPDGYFNPHKTATRAEVCQIIINLLNKL